MGYAAKGLKPANGAVFVHGVAELLKNAGAKAYGVVGAVNGVQFADGVEEPDPNVGKPPAQGAVLKPVGFGVANGEGDCATQLVGWLIAASVAAMVFQPLVAGFTKPLNAGVVL